MIPRILWTIWLSEDPKRPELIERCVQTHDLPGFEHRTISLGDCFKESRYLRECIEGKKWAKAVDFLRIYYLEKYGGVYLDADVEILPGATFEDVLDNKLFACREKNNFISNAIIGSEAGHPLLQKYLKTVEDNFIGSGDLIYQPGMYLWTELLNGSPEARVYDPDVFLPYDWQTDVMEKTWRTKTVHYFNRSWLPKEPK